MSPGRAAAALLTAAALACSSAEAQSVTDSASLAGVPDAIIVELALGRYVSRTMPAYRSGDEALLPLTQFADLAEFATLPLPSGGVELVLQPGNHKVTIDPASAEIRAGNTSVSLGAGDRVVQAGDQYLSTRVLAALLHVHFTVNWSDLSVALIDADSLPVGRRMTREKAVAAYRAAADALTPDLALGSDRARWDGLVLDYSLLAPSHDLLGGAYSTALGMNLMGGSLEATVASAGPPRDGNVRFDGSWTGVWRTNAWFTQLRVGDGLSSGPRPRAVRGFALSNVPFLRPALFGDIPFQGGLGPGWQIEAYRGGRLLAIDSADGLGRFSLDVPVEYGENPVDFVAYGPFGEVRQFNQTYRVVSDVIPARRLEYGVSLGGCRSVTCRANGNLDVRYGLSPRWTVRGGMDQFWRDTLPALSHPYVGVAGAIGNAWALEFEGVAAAVVRGAARYEPSQNIRISTEFNRFATGPVQPILTPQGRLTQWTTSAMARPFRRRNDVYVDATLDRITATTGRRDQRPTGGLVLHLPAAAGPGVPVHALQQPGRCRRAPSRSCRSTPSRCHSPSWARSSVASPGARRGNWTPTAGPRRWRLICRASWATPSNLEAGAGWNRGVGTTLSLFLSTQLAVGSHDHQHHGPAERAGRGQPVRPGLGAVRPRQPSHGLRERTVDRAGRRQRPGVPGRERGRPAGRRGRRAAPGRAGAGRLHLGGLGLLGPLSRVGPAGLRAGGRHARFGLARLAALGARLRLGQRRDRPQPLPEPRYSDRPGRGRSRARWSARRRAARRRSPV